MSLGRSSCSVTVLAAIALLGACERRAPPATATHDPLQAAFTVAFGKQAPYATLDDSGDHLTYSPQRLVPVAPGVEALISEATITEGCRLCAGFLTIHYLKADGARLARLGSWPDIGGRGAYGKALPWTIRNDLDDGPTLVTTEEQRDPQCSATLQELITLTPTRPVKIATVVLATAYGETPQAQAANRVSGAIKPIARGKRFEIRLTGVQSARQVYVRRGDVFASTSPGAPGC